MRALGYIVSWIVTLIGGTLLRGWALSILWGWFIVSTFHAQPLRIVEAIGVSLVVGFLTASYPKASTTESRPQSLLLIEAIGYSFLLPFITLGVGWIVHLFM